MNEIMNDENENVQVRVGDLGMSAYLLMHGYSCMGKQGREVIFEVEKAGLRDLDIRKREYLTSEFHRFDSCLMSLKKM